MAAAIRRFHILMLLAGLCAGLMPAAAHEFWIEPLQFRLDPETEIGARLKVGQNFAGDNLPWLPQQVAEAGIVDAAGARPLTGMVGDLPAISEQARRPGLNVLFYYSKPSTLTHTDPERFETFVRETGQDTLLQTHRDRGLPQTGFIEAFSRCAKALVQVGEAGGGDGLTEMPLELLAEASPHASESVSLPVRLFWLGEPLAGAQITVFRKSGDVQVMKLRTGRDGRAMVPLQGEATYMLSAVRMIPRDDETEIVWHSYWASMTFRIGDG